MADVNKFILNGEVIDVEDVSLRSTVADLLTDFGIVSNTVDDLSSDMTTAKDDIDALQDDMTTANDDIDTLQDDMTAAKNDIDDLQDDMTDAQNDIGNLQTAVAGKSTVDMKVVAFSNANSFSVAANTTSSQTLTQEGSDDLTGYNMRGLYSYSTGNWSLAPSIVNYNAMIVVNGTSAAASVNAKAMKVSSVWVKIT